MIFLIINQKKLIFIRFFIKSNPSLSQFNIPPKYPYNYQNNIISFITKSIQVKDMGYF